jgi:hypothetical protein
MEGAFHSMRVPMHCADSAPIRNAGIESPLAVLFRCLFFFCAPMVPAGDAARGEREQHAPTAFETRDPRNLCMCCHQRHAPTDSQRPHGRTEAIIMMASRTTSSWNKKPRHLTPCLRVRLAGSAEISTTSDYHRTRMHDLVATSLGLGPQQRRSLRAAALMLDTWSLAHVPESCTHGKRATRWKRKHSPPRE